MKDLSHDDPGKDLNHHPVPYFISLTGHSKFFLKIQIKVFHQAVLVHQHGQGTQGVFNNCHVVLVCYVTLNLP